MREISLIREEHIKYYDLDTLIIPQRDGKEKIRELGDLHQRIAEECFESAGELGSVVADPAQQL
jgi:hypothetical protein